MPQDHTFDIVSKLDAQEVKNAIQQALKEISTRFDFKGSKATIELDEAITLTAEDDHRLSAVVEILQTKLVKRGIPLKALEFSAKVESVAGGMRRQEISLQQGIPSEKAKEIVKIIKSTKLKVQAAIQGDQVRVSGKKLDDLQAIMARLKAEDLGINMEFANYR